MQARERAAEACLVISATAHTMATGMKAGIAEEEKKGHNADLSLARTLAAGLECVADHVSVETDDRDTVARWIKGAIERTEALLADWKSKGEDTPTDRGVIAGLEARKAALELIQKNLGSM